MHDTQLTRAFSAHLADALRPRCVDLAQRWLDELLERLPDEEPRRVFPSETLLNHIPVLLRRLCDAVEHDTDPSNSEFVLEELSRLATLRRAQGYTMAEVLEEFDILTNIFYEALLKECEAFGEPVLAPTAIKVARRIHNAIGLLRTRIAVVFDGEAAVDRLDRSRLLNDYVRALTHELRNRLNAMLWTVELLGDGQQLDDEGEELIGRLKRGLRRAADTVTDVFSVGLAHTANENVVHGKRASLAALVRQVEDDLQELASEATVELSADEELPHVQVDAPRTQLVLINLIGNAIKFADASKSERWVKIRCSPTDDELGFRVDIVDNGLGVPAEMHEQIFDEDVRGDSGDTPGQGLGLALARRAVEQMGGRIWLTSEPGAGSCFSFTVAEPPSSLDPLRREGAEEEGAQAPEDGGREGDPIQPGRPAGTSAVHPLERGAGDAEQPEEGAGGAAS